MSAASSIVRKKQDTQDKYLSALRELVNTGGGNRSCFDCGQKGPTYVNMQIGSFVCTRCSGVLRGLTPPHRVKSISMATFTQDEIDFLRAHGNDDCAKTWLGLWDPKRAIHQDQRELMIDKYERKRYYLEPASPLKSLTNAASLKAATQQQQQPQSASSQLNASQSSMNGNSNNNNNNSNQQHTTNGHKTSSNLDNGFSSIQLTPPTIQRTTANGLQQHQNSKSSSSAISRPQHSHQQQQNGFNHHHQQQQQQQDAFMLNGNGNGNGFLAHHGFGSGSVGSTSTGAMSDTSSCASNGFGPDADFVADFGSADIFNATSAGSVGSPAVSSASSVASSNGYAKIQPIKAARQQQQQQQQQHQFMNGHANGQAQLNGTSSMNGNGETENFADFDHAPIYNAAGAIPIPNGNHKNSFSSSNNSYKLGSTPSEDRYAALKDLDEQLRESKAVAATAASVVATSVLDSFGNNNNLGMPNAGSINPFKSQQLQQQQQPNPFQIVGTPNTNNNNNHIQHQQQQNVYGQLTVIPNGMANGTNGFGLQQTPPQPTAFFNYNGNGFTSAPLHQAGGINAAAGQTAAPTTTAYTAGIPNGCGFGFGTGVGALNGIGGGVGVGQYVNPFAASGAMNTNNPFL